MHPLPPNAPQGRVAAPMMRSFSFAEYRTGPSRAEASSSERCLSGNKAGPDRTRPAA